MKIVFMGTMDFAVPILFGLADKYEVVLVVTQPDKPAGRSKTLKSSSVKTCALSLNIPVFQPASIKRDYQPIIDADPDLIVVCAYGQMIPDEVLFYPRYRSLNVHASLLPKYRGGAPMQRAIMAGDSETGVTVMFMESKMDSGPLLTKAKIPILSEDNVKTLEGKLAVLGRNLLLDTLPAVFDGKINPTPQDESLVTFAYNLKPHEEQIEFAKSAKAIFDHIRALNPSPGAYAKIDGRKLKILKAEVVDETDHFEILPGVIIHSLHHGVCVKTGKGYIRLLKVQLEGRNAMDIAAFMNGSGRDLLAEGRKFN